MGTRGQPKISYFIEQCIAFKVMQYAKRYNESHYKAWFRLTKHRAFKDLMKDHYKNTSHPEHWVQRLTTSFEAQKKFYTKHIKKWVNKRTGIGSLQDWSFKYKLIKTSRK